MVVVVAIKGELPPRVPDADVQQLDSAGRYFRGEFVGQAFGNDRVCFYADDLVRVVKV
jgi:hypothetical protein